MDLSALRTEVGGVEAGPVSMIGLGTRGGAVVDVRQVRAPNGVEIIEADEMIVVCGAATPVDDLKAALAEHRQTVVLPDGGTVGGALAVGRSGIRRLGDGPIRDCLLQAHFVDANGAIVMAGGPTVKNVSGFDLCRLLVGSCGTLGFLGSVRLRTRPLPLVSRWYVSERDPAAVFAALYRPSSVLTDGRRTWALLEGHGRDVEAQAIAAGLSEVDAAPTLSGPFRWSLPPRNLLDEGALRSAGRYVAEVGVGIVHSDTAAPSRLVDPVIRRLSERLKTTFDPTGRLNPGRMPLG